MRAHNILSSWGHSTSMMLASLSKPDFVLCAVTDGNMKAPCCDRFLQLYRCGLRLRTAHTPCRFDEGPDQDLHFCTLTQFRH